MDLELKNVEKQLEEKSIKLEVTEEAKNWLGTKGYDETYGARPLRRLIQDTVEDKLSETILEGRLQAGDTVVIDCEEDEIVIRMEVLAPAPA